MTNEINKPTKSGEKALPNYTSPRLAVDGLIYRIRGSSTVFRNLRRWDLFLILGRRFAPRLEASTHLPPEATWKQSALRFLGETYDVVGEDSCKATVDGDSD